MTSRDWECGRRKWVLAALQGAHSGEKCKHSGQIWGRREIIHPWGCRGWEGSNSNFLEILLSCILLVSGTSRLVFKLSHLLPNSSQLLLGPPSNQYLSWVFWGFVPLSYPILFPDFARLYSSLLCSAFWLLLYMPESSASPSGFYCPCV